MSSRITTEEPEDPIGYFLEDLTYHGKSERTRTSYERVLRRFEDFIENKSPGEATHRDCMAFIHSIRGQLADSTVATYAAYLHRFYAYMTQVGVFEGNPMTLVMEEMDETVDKDPTRRDIPIAEMRTFLAGISHPLHRALICTLLKTGVRVGELCNLDLRDLSIDDPELAAAYDLGTRPALANRPDSLYVTPDATVGEVLNGEERTASNKRKRETVIPIDDELAHELKAWLAIRPDTPSPAQPVFVGTSEGWGQRLDPEAVRHIVTRYTKAVGWYRPGGGASENVTPHYFRHFFTTHLRDRTGDRGIVKYLRGDVADDIIDTYTHNWGDQVRETYERNIYRLVSKSVV
ncbi:tyrosine-type recombinase/integrase [Halorubrum vacuolatum]|uniref:Site-specific recombinase XerD n=1 Tax=Halorubrum vacuolatum TaxID=63740 RepID=A0A238VEF9_HALVU|nr:tyrosine-type recombinase/integrase [Halorubrum vacuolatum]SNR32636.1 Site-specific recombinase XerD [Halorubrum vacuolatum]